MVILFVGEEYLDFLARDCAESLTQAGRRDCRAPSRTRQREQNNAVGAESAACPASEQRTGGDCVDLIGDRGETVRNGRATVEKRFKHGSVDLEAEVLLNANVFGQRFLAPRRPHRSTCCAARRARAERQTSWLTGARASSGLRQARCGKPVRKIRAPILQACPEAPGEADAVVHRNGEKRRETVE